MRIPLHARSPGSFAARKRGYQATPILGVALRCLAAVAVALLTVSSFYGQSQEVVRDHPIVHGWADHKLVPALEGCPALPTCLSILDTFVSPRNRGQLSGVGREIADNLRRFGEPAKQELLRRAA